MSIGDLFKNFWKLKIFNFREQILVIYRYYKNIRFCLIDLCLFIIYFFINPYRISKKFLKKKKCKNIHVYGETPFSTFEKIINRCNIQPHHHFLELGSGRGKCAFWLSEIKKCKVDAIEWIPIFHSIAFWLNKIFRNEKLKFYLEDMFNIDYRPYDIIFLYGTCLQDYEICSLIEKLRKTKENCKIITISYSLNEYDGFFEVINQFEVLFPWGETTCYINKKNKIPF